ncbi:hypothetical protein H107_08207, partial [Trichophyton rubrum CBS 202.88]
QHADWLQHQEDKKKRKAKKEAEISSWGLALFPQDPPAGNTASSTPRYSLTEGPLILSWTLAFELHTANGHTKSLAKIGEMYGVCASSEIYSNAACSMVSAGSSGDGEESFLEFATGEELGNPRRYPNWSIPVVITICKKRCQKHNGKELRKR